MGDPPPRLRLGADPESYGFVEWGGKPPIPRNGGRPIVLTSGYSVDISIYITTRKLGCFGVVPRNPQIWGVWDGSNLTLERSKPGYRRLSGPIGLIGTYNVLPEAYFAIGLTKPIGATLTKTLKKALNLL